MLYLTLHTEVGQMKHLERSPTPVPLRPKNQITLPVEIARALGAAPGDRLLFTMDPENPDTALLRRVRGSYFGVLTGAYGTTHEELLDYVRAEQDGWAE
jgi:bifunctional DNA-binding transcriptional regulator/antitoxin component of YhaV-PrlF toxin-antitoxin module